MSINTIMHIQNLLVQHLPALVATPINFSSVNSSLQYLLVLALLIDALIVALWYMFGTILGNTSIKNGAKGEFMQVVGTGIIAAIVFTTITLFGAVYITSLATGSTVAPNPNLPLPITQPRGAFQQCSILSASQLQIVRQMVFTEFEISPETNVGSSPTYAPSVCDIISEAAESNQAPGTLTADYPLAVTALINANLTSQVGGELSDLFIVDSYMSFLKTLTPYVGICIGIDSSCALTGIPGSPPLPFASGFGGYISYSVKPLAGIDLAIKTDASMSNLLYLSLIYFVIQLAFINIFLYIWPYFIFFGIVLRGLFFTRKLGGLLIAIAIGAIIFYPVIVSMEYLASINTNLVPQTSTTPPFAPVSFCGDNSYTYQLNFFNLPSIAGIASDCGCWPGNDAAFGGGLPSVEQAEVLTLSEFTTYGYNIVATILGAYGNIGPGSTPSSWAGLQSIFTEPPYAFPNLLKHGITFTGVGAPVCPIGEYYASGPGSPNDFVNYATGSEGFSFGLTQAYGVVGVTTYFIPIINILITLAAILGLSGILGGDTNLAGISRFV